MFKNRRDSLSRLTRERLQFRLASSTYCKKGSVSLGNLKLASSSLRFEEPFGGSWSDVTFGGVESVALDSGWSGGVNINLRARGGTVRVFGLPLQEEETG